MEEMSKQKLVNVLENLSDYISRTIDAIQTNQYEITDSEVWVDKLEHDIETINKWSDQIRESLIN